MSKVKFVNSVFLCASGLVVEKVTKNTFLSLK